jgi:3-(3-hydroxy-phenyl)propionate hydroxylase
VLARAAHDPAARAAVDSGRLAEPFWYADSPLTTPDPRRPFAGRPPRGQVPPAGPGVLLPDGPVVRPDGARNRLRALARDGFLLLTGPTSDATAARAAAADAPGPVRVLALGAIDSDAIDSDGTLAAALAARDDEVWVVRPDAHVAAVLHHPSPPDVRAALLRAVAHPRKESHDGPLPAVR